MRDRFLVRARFRTIHGYLPGGSLVQSRRPQKRGAIGGPDADRDRTAVAHHGEGYLDAGIAARPDAPEQRGEIGDLLAADIHHQIADPQVRLLGWTTAGQPGDHELVLDLGGVEPEPWPWRLAPAAELEQVVEDRRQ